MLQMDEEVNELRFYDNPKVMKPLMGVAAVTTGAMVGLLLATIAAHYKKKSD
jgi:hypothetical protein